jgi:mycofactocin precursor
MVCESTAAVAEPVEPTAATGPDQTLDDEVVVDDMLVEEVSIDGMCGVY